MTHTSEEIRKKFLAYFKKQGHREVPSSPVVPLDDPTLLFTNAGMNQFKDVFLGKARRDYSRAVTSQKCIRSSGKHNDLENVGHTTRHCTFFEMLGNFSFGDYFKKEAIQFAWEVSTTVFGFHEDKIWPTVFFEDDEAFELWTRYVPSSRIIRMGEKENFWSMGDTGPCGPCSELLYDRGKHYSTAQTPLEDTTGERFLEFWNLVFMQYNRREDGTKEPLPRPSIDTGAGLERVMSLMLKTESVFETDILRSLIGAVENVASTKYEPDAKNAAAFRVIADHVRSLSFAIADGAQPSNTDRGYALRKILRRAVRYGRQLGLQEPFLASLVPNLIETMGGSYPELITSRSRIEQVLTIEEESFLRTLKRGGAMFNTVVSRSINSGVISGDDAFLLKDTYGLPYEEIQLFAKDTNCTVDQARYEILEEEARLRSKSARKTTTQLSEQSLYEDVLNQVGESVFTRHYPSLQAEVVGCLKDGKLVESLSEGEAGEILLNETPFYPEMGGQVGDKGILVASSGSFHVGDTKSPFKGIIVHCGKVEKGTITVKNKVMASIDMERRKKIEANHTATHLLHWALGEVLGEHIRQKGSYVDDMYLRFDFSHHKQVTEAEIEAVELLVNQMVCADLPVATYELPYEEAQKRADIKQFFGEKYGDDVRVVEAGNSKELCGGTHTWSTGKVGFFRIRKESSIAAGMRRIEAVTQDEAYFFSKKAEDRIHALAEKLKVPDAKVEERVEKLLSEIEVLEGQVQEFKKNKLASVLGNLSCRTMGCGNVYSGILPIDSTDIKNALEEMVLQKPDYAIVIIGVATPKKGYLAIRTHEKVAARFPAKKLLAFGLEKMGGTGGGKDTFAQGASDRAEALPSVIEEILSFLSSE